MCIVGGAGSSRRVLIDTSCVLLAGLAAVGEF